MEERACAFCLTICGIEITLDTICSCLKNLFYESDSNKVWTKFDNDESWDVDNGGHVDNRKIHVVSLLRRKTNLLSYPQYSACYPQKFKGKDGDGMGFDADLFSQERHEVPLGLLIGERTRRFDAVPCSASSSNRVLNISRTYGLAVSIRKTVFLFLGVDYRHDQTLQYL